MEESYESSGYTCSDRNLRKSRKHPQKGRHIKKAKNSTDTENAEVESVNDDGLTFNSLPPEICIKIFGYLTHNEMCRVARVCRRWAELIRNPTLWKKVEVKLHQLYGSQNRVATKFVEKLPVCVAHIKLDFIHQYQWMKPLNFEELSVKLQNRCPNLQTLILHNSVLSESLPTVIHLSSLFIRNIKTLAIHYSSFGKIRKGESGGISKIEILDICVCSFHYLYKPTFLKSLPHLKWLNLGVSCVNDSWFQDDFSFLNNLEMLDLGCTWIRSRTFQTVKNCALNLTELYLCNTDLKDEDMNISNSAFPRLKTICLKSCRDVTCEGIVSLVQSCQTLQNVYVSGSVAETYAVHPFISANEYKLKIVESVYSCFKHRSCSRICF